MGKNLIQQRRGRGTSRFRAPSHRYVAAVKHRPGSDELVKGTIKDIVHCPGHSSPLVEIWYEDNIKSFIVAPEGVKVGDVVAEGQGADVKVGNTLPLKSIPEGTNIFNIESKPGDGGKFVRSSGATARVLAKYKNKVVVELPSKKKKEFNPCCRASIGIVAGAGRVEKPFFKAGRKWFARQRRGKFFPKVTAQSMNAVDHPFGGSRSSRKGRPTIAPRHAPPGRKVGMLRPKRTGRKKR